MGNELSYRTAAEETWRVFRIMSEFVEAIDLLSSVGPAVSIFGSARTPAGTKYYDEAVALAERLGKDKFSIITGGGPGIMEAANKGAMAAGVSSIGLNISLPHEQTSNKYQNVSLSFNHFFVRKVMFVKYAVAFVCFPGGFGTMDEFFEAMTLIQTGKIHPFPVVLFGSTFWNPMVSWMRETMLGSFQNIGEADLELFLVTDGIEPAANFIRRRFEQDRSLAGQPTAAEEMKAPPEQRTTVEGTVFGKPPVPDMDNLEGW